MIVSGGENVYSVEVEAVIDHHPMVQECAVIGIPSERWGEAVHAVVSVQAGGEVSEQELIEFCRDKIAGYKCPKSVSFHEGELPKSSVGKILKRELRIPFWGDEKRNVN